VLRRPLVLVFRARLPHLDRPNAGVSPWVCYLSSRR
jgi:hypothetical protein